MSSGKGRLSIPQTDDSLTDKSITRTGHAIHALLWLPGHEVYLYSPVHPNGMRIKTDSDFSKGVREYVNSINSRRIRPS